MKYAIFFSLDILGKQQHLFLNRKIINRKMADNKIQPHKDNLNGFAHEIRYIIDNAHIHAVRSIDHVRVVMYWFIGKRIFEEGQMGKENVFLKDWSMVLSIDPTWR
jgi:hypothetical protein